MKFSDTSEYYADKSINYITEASKKTDERFLLLPLIFENKKEFERLDKIKEKEHDSFKHLSDSLWEIKRYYYQKYYNYLPSKYK